MIEWVAAGLSPAEFWTQTPRSFVSIMQAKARAAKAEYDRAIFLAWHTAVFALNGYAGKLKELGSYLQAKPIARNQTAAEMLHIMREFQERGASMKITRREHVH